jgi:hypothetical protein
MMAADLFYYEIRIATNLTDSLLDWFEGLAVQNDPDGSATLRGSCFDQSSLIGLLTLFQKFNITVLSLSVTRSPSL